MKLSMNAVVAMALVAGGSAIAPVPARAHKEFLEEFKKVYVPDENAPLAKAVESAKCVVCHGEKSKKERNAYGVALDELLSKEDKKDADKIRKALAEVEGRPSDPENKESPTFGALLKDGKLPMPAK